MALLKKYAWLLLPAALLLQTCSGSSDDVIPYTYVNEHVFLNTIQGQKLSRPPYYIYIVGGVKGIIVYHDVNAGKYLAFERNCTYHPKNACALVTVEPLLANYMIDTCCGSRFDFSGAVLSAPAGQPLLQYNVNTTLSPNELAITN